MEKIYQWVCNGYNREYGTNTSAIIAYSLNKNQYPDWGYIDSDVKVRNVRYKPIEVTYQQYDFIRNRGGIVYTNGSISEYINRIIEAERKKREEQKRQREAEAMRQKMERAKAAAEKKEKEKEQMSDIIGFIIFVIYFSVAVLVFIFYANEEFDWIYGSLYSLFWIYCIPIHYFFYT